MFLRVFEPWWYLFDRLSDYFPDDAPADVGQLLVPAGVEVCQPVLVETHQVQEGGVDDRARGLSSPADARPRNRPSRRRSRRA